MHGKLLHNLGERVVARVMARAAQVCNCVLQRCGCGCGGTCICVRRRCGRCGVRLCSAHRHQLLKHDATVGVALNTLRHVAHDVIQFAVHALVRAAECANLLVWPVTPRPGPTGPTRNGRPAAARWPSGPPPD